MEDIRNLFSDFTAQSDEDWEFFSSRLQGVSFPKHALVLRKGEVEKHLSFVEEGVLRMYIPKPENDVTFSFVFPGNFISAYDSFLTQTPCPYQVQALTDVKLHRISYQSLQEVYAHTKVGHEIGRKSAEGLFLAKAKREMSLLTKTAEERYLDLFTQRPELIRHIPLKYIASYIGITPQALSRIRSRIS